LLAGEDDSNPAHDVVPLLVVQKNLPPIFQGLRPQLSNIKSATICPAGIRVDDDSDVAQGDEG